MSTLVVATTNRGKVRELAGLLGPSWTLRSGLDLGHLPEVVEDADSFQGNAALKAHAFARALGQWALADDSGLCVDALGGRPGVLSSRYAATDEARVRRLLEELQGVPDAQRTARFRCALCLAGPAGDEVFTQGVCEGWIGHAPRGLHGFGYDPVFEVGGGVTLAELDEADKAAISHRGAALRAMLPQLLHRVRSP
jgi:XTP/dITP diphosphohydrolase